MNDVTLGLETKLKSFTDEGDVLNKEREKLVEQNKANNKRLSEIQARALHLQGSYKAINDLLAEEKKSVKPTDEKKSKK